MTLPRRQQRPGADRRRLILGLVLPTVGYAVLGTVLLLAVPLGAARHFAPDIGWGATVLAYLSIAWALVRTAVTINALRSARTLPPSLEDPSPRTAPANPTSTDRGPIDYTSEDVTQTDVRFDAVFDAVGKSTFARCRPLLKPGAPYLTTDLGPRAQNLALIPLTRWVGDHRVPLPGPTNARAHVLLVRELLAEGRLRPVIDRTYALDDIVEACRYVESGQKLGDVVVTIT